MSQILEVYSLHYRAVQHSFILHYCSFSIHFYSRHVNNYGTISSDFTAVNAAIGLYAFCSSFGHIKQHIISRDFLNDSGAAVSEGIVPGGGSALLYCQGLGSFGGWLPADRNCKREFLFFEFGAVGDRHDIYGSKSIPRLISLPVTFFVSQVRRSWRSDQLEWDGFGHSSTSQDWNLNGLENGWIANLMNAFPGTDSYRIPWLQFFCRDLWVNFPKLNWAPGGTTSKKKWPTPPTLSKHSRHSLHSDLGPGQLWPKRGQGRCGGFGRRHGWRRQQNQTEANTTSNAGG